MGFPWLLDHEIFGIPRSAEVLKALQRLLLGDGSRFDSPDRYVNYVGYSERRLG
jgi:hypothetical protein